ncbi:MAG TPA: tetratricopeptide repeat protein [Gemmatimonadota bacterium]|nr:tetratricopeptide repeat protein [Gemmatimonadota bacterium]
MLENPTGTVTFLATDIQGSTEMWERYPGPMASALRRHDEILRAALESRNGRIFKNLGDGLLSAFSVAPAAVEAALEGQRALIAEAWPTPVPVRVRMALHSGEAEEREGDYFGPPVNRVARIVSAGHGGQILLSQAVERLAANRFPEGVALRDLGERSLKDLTQPERLFQLVSDGLPAEFPPLDTLDARPHNLPAQPSPIVGRERDIEEVRRLLVRPDVRLVTLLGPSGAGKSRLALQVAAEVVDRFRDGVYNVEMAVVHEPDQVAGAILEALGVKPEGKSSEEALREHLRPRELLLLLDNFEQVLDAAPLVADLLRNAPRLTILVTSQAPLRLRGEHEQPVSTLAVPGPRAPRQIERLASYDAVALFTERAQAVVPSFRLQEDNADAVVEIVRQLDGLPLAIELAAARLKLFSPQAMVSRLSRRFDFLKGGGRDLPDRQRTLRSALEWSYNLLSEEERALFRRQAVFDGGFTLEAAERVTVAEGEDLDVVEIVSSLVDKSLLRSVPGEDGEPRFFRLRSIRDFSLDLLENSGEADIWRRRHAEYFAGLAEEGDPGNAPRHDTPEKLARVQREFENLRAALAWALDHGESEIALRLCRGLPALWFQGGQFAEMRRLVEQLQTLPFENGVQRAHAINMAGRFAQLLGDNSPGVIAKFEEALALYREAGHHAGTARALMNLGNVRAREGAFEEARRLFREALPLYRDLGDVFGECGALMNLGDTYLGEDDLDCAEEMFEEARRTGRAKGDRVAVAFATQYLGAVRHQRGDLDGAEARFRESLGIFEAFSAGPGIAWSWYYLANIARDRGDLTGARRTLLDVGERFREFDYRPGIAVSLLSLATIDVREGSMERAARLLGASRALRRDTRMTREAPEEKAEEEVEKAGRTALGEGGFDLELEAGKRLGVDDALKLARGDADREPVEATGTR